MSDANKKSRSVSYHGVLLGGMALVASALLAGGHDRTHQEIAARATEDLQRSLSQVIPDALHDNNPASQAVTISNREGKPVSVYQATRNGKVTAVAFEVSNAGYSGDIALILGIDRDGKLLGVRVLHHTETPGLGDKMETGKGKWIFGFDGLSLGNPPLERWKVKKDGGQFDQFTGATITPRAIVGAIREGLQWFDHERQTLLAPPSPATQSSQSPIAAQPGEQP